MRKSQIGQSLTGDVLIEVETDKISYQFDPCLIYDLVASRLRNGKTFPEALNEIYSSPSVCYFGTLTYCSGV